MSENDYQTNKRILSGLKRLIYSKIFKSKQVCSLKPNERLLYIGMILFSDDNGRFVADDRILKADIFALDKISVKNVRKMKENIKKVDLIKIYESNNEEFGYHPNWYDYQNIRKDRQKVSKIPPPPGFVEDIRQPNDNQMTAQTNKNESKLIKYNLNEYKNSLGGILLNKESSSFSNKGHLKVSQYIPNNYEEGRALEIAKWLGEEYFDYILNKLQKNGLKPLTDAFEIIKEHIKDGKQVDNKRSYYNGILENIIKPVNEVID